DTASSTAFADAVALGNNAQALATGGVAIGLNSSATGANSVALGQGSVADQANTVSVGAAGSERKIVNVAAGALSSTSTDAVNGSQLLTANQRVASAFGTTLDGSGQLNAPNYTIQSVAFNNVGSAFGAVDNALTTNKNNISSLQNQINNGSIG